MPGQAPAPPRIWYTLMDSPFGPVCVAGVKAGLLRVDFQRGNRPVCLAAAWQEDSEILRDALHQLQEYFQGQRQSFTLPLAPPGTPFQQRVWQELQGIPFGTTLTYRDSLSPPHWQRWPVARLRGWYRPQTASATARRRTILALSSWVSPAWTRLVRTA